MIRKQLREHAFGKLSVLNHIRNAGRNSQIILENVKVALVIANEIGSANVRPDIVTRTNSSAFDL